MATAEEMTIDMMSANKIIVTDTYLHKMTVYDKSVTENDSTQDVCT